jgi:glycosyltransferase involved in cell wall biosynthesis
MRLSYAVVTPARNEADNIRRLAGSLRAQTLAPAAWVIVDNGSTDDTVRLAQELAGEDASVSVIEAPGERTPTRGGPVARAFSAGLEQLTEQPDVVVKLDADVSFEPDFFSRLLAEFERDPALGIAGGTCYELEDGAWKAKHATGDRVRGATRAYRWACLQTVLPLEHRAGWDGIDELRAIARGFRTRSFADLPFYHHRRLAERDESRRRRLFETGRSNWYSGYRPSYVLLRSLFKARRELAALALVGGYASAALRREPRCPDPVARAYLRREQSFRRLPRRIREARGR